MLLKALIVDDEPGARRLIQHLCKQHGNIKVIAEAANGKIAIDIINKYEPDVVFLDIQLPDMTGLEVLEQLSFKPNIIFTTAYEHFALKAFDTFAVDYLLKPISEERFAAAIAKLDHFGKLNSQINFTELQKIIRESRSTPKLKTLTVKIGSKMVLLDFDDIAYVEANDKYVNIFTIEGTRYLHDLTLTQLEEKLSDYFLRIQKSFIINTTLIKEIHKHFNSRHIFVLKDKSATRLTSGLTYYDSIKAHLGL